LKNVLLKGVLLAVGLILFFKVGLRLMLVGWRLFVPMLVITVGYFIVRQIIQNKKLAKKPDPDTLGSGQPIAIWPRCHKPRGSCPKCQA